MLDKTKNLLNRIIFNHQKLYYCCFCGRSTVFNDFGDPSRSKVQCSVCGSLERHRFLFYVYNILFLGSKNKIKLLHMAPERCIHDLLKKYDFIDYVSADLNPESHFFADCKKEDFQKMSFEDKIFDVILLNQVLEHIEEEQLCLSEIKRCLKDDGLAIVNIPFKVGLEETLEDIEIKNNEDRKKYYGQNDHVRLYGEDAYLRFSKAGFIVNQIDEDFFDNKFLSLQRLKIINLNGINPGGYFILKKQLV